MKKILDWLFARPDGAAAQARSAAALRRRLLKLIPERNESEKMANPAAKSKGLEEGV